MYLKALGLDGKQNFHGETIILNSLELLKVHKQSK